MKKIILLASVSIFAITAQNAFSASHAKTEMMKKEVMDKAAMMKKEAMDKDAMMKKEAMGKDAMMKKEAMGKDAMMKKEAMSKDAMMKKEHMMTSDYTVKSGDSLWTIAKHAYGSGSMYMKIKMANEGISDDLEVGQMIKLPK